ncbi:MAG: HigA family addiction module antidote protein [Nitrospirae bacterium]|nr:HigA family addiction module antidote protein [Magnetococcales bacterium]HAT50349.1 addiction module antidote protein, HigA family [Alphaproteobacteria bacterium]
MRKRTPSHPGEVLRHLYMDPLGLKVVDLANKLQVSRKTVSKILNGRGGIEVYLALRLSRVFNTTPQLWINLQSNYDLAIMEEQDQVWGHIEPFEACAI